MAFLHSDYILPVLLVLCMSRFTSLKFGGIFKKKLFKTTSPDKIKDGKLSWYFLLPVEAIFFNCSWLQFQLGHRKQNPLYSCSFISSPRSAEPKSVTAVTIILAQHTSFP